MALAAKEREALAEITETLAGRGAAVAFGGGKDSVTLLHLVRRACGGRVSVPVLTLAPPAINYRIYWFLDKMARMWGFRKNWERVAVGRPAVPEPSSEAFRGAGLLALAAKGVGYRTLLTGTRRDEEGAAGVQAVNECAGVSLVNPLRDFTEEEVFEYARVHGLPLCSLYGPSVRKLGCLPASLAEPSAVPPDAVQSADPVDDEKLKARLRGLGYI